MTARGTSDVKRRVLGFVSTNAASWLEAVRTEWGLQPHELPEPIEYVPAMPQAVSRYPTCAIVVPRMPTTRLRGHNDANERAVESTYNCQLYLWIRYQSQHENDNAYERVQIVRDDLTAAFRSMLLTTPSLAQADHKARLVETSMIEDYSSVQPVKGERAVAASYLGFQVRVEEALARPATATVDTVDTGTDILDPQGARS